MKEEEYKIFKTQIGYCAIAWNGTGVTKLMLPQKNRVQMEDFWGDKKQIKRSPEWVKKAIGCVKDHLSGRLSDLTWIPLDWQSFSPFYQAIYKRSRHIPYGTTISYTKLAARAGNKKGARACGSAMAKNPFPLLVPCHRVIPSSGKLGNFSSYGGSSLKQRLLAMEGYTIRKMGKSTT